MLANKLSTNGRSAFKIRPALVDKSEKTHHYFFPGLHPVINFLFSDKIAKENSNRNDVSFCTKRWRLRLRTRIQYAN